MDFETLNWQLTDGLAVIELNRPDALNAWTPQLGSELLAAVRVAGDDPDIRAVLITGAGRAFSSGADLRSAREELRPGVTDFGIRLRTVYNPVILAVAEAPKPVIAAVNGAAAGIGAALALACDLIVAARGARLGVPEVKRSLVAAGGALLRLPRVLPRNVANELALTGDPIDAERAYELGLVNHLAEPGQALDVALQLAERIAANGPLALAATKRVMVESADWSDGEFFDRQRPIIDPVFASEDAREGATAFSERRDPVWKGR